MPAAGLAPDEFARTDCQPLRRTLFVDELSLKNIGLLDLDVLMIRQRRARRKFHQRSDKTARLVEQKAFDLAPGKPGLLPFHVDRTHDMRMGIGGVVFGFWRHGIHLYPPRLSVSSAFA